MVEFYGKQFTSRMLIGTALYPSPAIMQQAIRASGAEIATVSLRREFLRRPHRQYLLGPDPRTWRHRAAQHGRLP